MHAALVGAVDGVRLVSPERTALISTPVTADHDRVLGAPIPKVLGYFAGLPEMGTSARAFGCKGSGGSIAFADPELEFAFALTHNRLTAPPADSAAGVADRVRSALGIGGRRARSRPRQRDAPEGTPRASRVASHGSSADAPV
jgi:CubicO group peptidase (beta-lactamase class C family)